jgi:serpin B
MSACFSLRHAFQRQLFAVGLIVFAASSQTNAQSTVPPHERAPLTPAISGVATANNRFAIDLFAELRAEGNDGDNLMISPLSISTALAMTYAGARGNTAAQMAEVLHLDAAPAGEEHAGFGQLIVDLNDDRPGYDLSVVNRLFGRQGFDFREAFLQQLAADYGAPLEQLDFGADPDGSRNHINSWVASQTNDRIKDLLPPGSVTGETRLVLTNAVYFNGKWRYQFDPNDTRDLPFHLADGSAPLTPTMYQEGEFAYGQFDGFQMLEMQYSGQDLSMVLMLPNERDGLPALEAAFTEELFRTNVGNLHPKEVEVFLPKFTFKDRANLNTPLQDLGMTDAFTDHADFSGMRDGGGLTITDVLHQTFIDFNESGTEAAGATGVVIGPTSVPPPPPIFRADHPFLFALRDRHTGALLFLGRMADPGAATAAVLAEIPEPSAAVLALLCMVSLFACRKRCQATITNRRQPPLHRQGSTTHRVRE